MNALYFGSSDQPLYGHYTPSGQVSARAPAIVLCNPFGVEAIRAYRIFKVLAERLSENGCAVLRFDYRGSGDSGGECSDFTPEIATQNILSAHQEIMDLSGKTRVVWIGLRLGALLALKASEGMPKGLRGVICWEAISDGAEYLEELKEAHIAELSRAFDLSKEKIMKMHGGALEAEALGIEMSAPLRAELSDLGIAKFSHKPARYLGVLERETSTKFDHFDETGTKLIKETDEQNQEWNSDAALNAFSIPTKTIKQLVEMVEVMR